VAIEFFTSYIRPSKHYYATGNKPDSENKKYREIVKNYNKIITQLPTDKTSHSIKNSPKIRSP